MGPRAETKAKPASPSRGHPHWQYLLRHQLPTTGKPLTAARSDLASAEGSSEGRSIETRPSRRYWTVRPEDVHSTSPWSRFGEVNRQLTAAVHDLLSCTGLGTGARALDYGCGERPYRSLLPAGAQYVGADLPGNASADIELTARGLVPLPDSSFDLVLSTQVLEHVEDPDAYLQECSRLLVPGGWLLLSTHGIMYYHQDPEDYWRWTRAGLEKLLGDHGFEMASSRGVLGLVAAALQIIQDGTFWYLPRPLRRPFAILMQGLIVLSDRLYPRANRVNNCLTIAVLARKRADTAS
jgi:SAM-dependent methyltransferase